jgi:hypothetical protein
VLGTALMVACSSGGTPVTQQSNTTSAAAAAVPSAAPTPPPPPSDEDQVKETVMAFQDAYNTKNWDAYAELMCTSMRAKFTGVVMDYLKKGRQDTGLTQIKTITPVITGDTAVVTMDAQNETMGTQTVKLPLKREDGWHAPRSTIGIRGGGGTSRHRSPWPPR